jgi:hypothetical protein
MITFDVHAPGGGALPQSRRPGGVADNDALALAGGMALFLPDVAANASKRCNSLQVTAKAGTL